MLPQFESKVAHACKWCRSVEMIMKWLVERCRVRFQSVLYIWCLTPTLLPWFSPVYSGVSWQHAAAAVPGHVQANSGRGRNVHGGDPECFQPPPHRAPQIWPEGKHVLLSYIAETCIDHTIFTGQNYTLNIISRDLNHTSVSLYICNRSLN